MRRKYASAIIATGNDKKELELLNKVTFLAVLLSALLMLIAPAPAFAQSPQQIPGPENASQAQSSPEETEEDFSVEATLVNPLMEEALSAEDGESVSHTPAMEPAQEPNCHTSVDTLAAELRSRMKNREEGFTLAYLGAEKLVDADTDSARSDQLRRLVTQWFSVHTGESTEGDYLKWQYQAFDILLHVHQTEGQYYHTITVSPKYSSLYYTTAQEEKLVDERVEELRSALFSSGMSDYQKIRAAYDYICSHVVYDHNSREKEQAKNYHPWTAYGALVEGESVCQGYALALYRLMLEEGIDCRIISGYGDGEYHAWNIVRLDGLYYYLDATWDRDRAGIEPYQWFLKGSDSFTNHIRDNGDVNPLYNYDDEAFRSAYPMSSGDYMPLSPAEITGAACYSQGLLLTWRGSEGAERYQVWRREGESRRLIADTAKNSLLVPGLTIGENCAFSVSCTDALGNLLSAPSAEREVIYELLPTPKLLSAQCTAQGVTLRWQGTAGGGKFRVFYRERGSSVWTAAGDTSDTTMTVNYAFSSGTRYVFTVRCVSADRRYYASGYDSRGISLTYLSAPVVKNAYAVNGGVQVNWESVPGSVRYRVYYRTGGGSWIRGGDTSGNSLRVGGLTTGLRYTFTVRCVSADGRAYTSGYNPTGITLDYLNQPVLAKAQNVYGGVQVSWHAVSGAARYRVYYRTGGGGWTLAGAVSDTSYLVKGLRSGVRYAFTVRCISADNRQYTSGYHAAGLNLIYVASPQISRASTSGGNVTLMWNKVAGGTKYRVFYRIGSGAWVRAGDTAANSLTVRGLKKGRAYTFTVRCITPDGKGYLSGYNLRGISVIPQ